MKEFKKVKKGFSKNLTEMFSKTMFHNVPNILKYIDEIEDKRKRVQYPMRYLIMSEMMMFLSEGKSQRFIETAYNETNYLENINKIVGTKVEKIPDSEIYTNVFSKIEKEEIEKFQYKINNRMIRNKKYSESKVLGKYNSILDGTRFQKAHYEVGEEWLSQEIEGKKIWYIAMLELKIISHGMAVSLMSEMIKNEDKKKENETEKDIERKSEEEIKQDCEINATKRLIKNFREQYPRLPIRIIGDSLYPSQEIFRKLRELDIEYIFVLKDKKIPSITEEFFTLVSLPEGERFIMETKEATIITMWANEIDYNGEKVNVIRQIRRNKEDGSNSVWMWITNREITRMNVSKIIYCGKQRSYIENQGFREQKITSGIELEHVYSKNIKAIRVIYGIIQIVHLILQIIEHSDICGDFKQKYGSVKVFEKKFYADLTKEIVNIKIIQIKIQIHFNKSTLTYVDYTK